MTLATPANTPNPRSAGFDIQLGDYYYRLAAAPRRELITESAPLQQARVDTSANANEVSLEFGLRYSRNDFTNGEGLRLAYGPQLEPDDDERYYDSRNIDFLEDKSMTLLAIPEQLEASAQDPILAAQADGTLYFTNGNQLRKTDDPEAASPTFADEDPHAAQTAEAINGLASVGTTIYAAIGTSGIHRKESGGSWAHWSDIEGYQCWEAKGRILVDDGNGDLYEARAGGASVLIVSGTDGTVWNDVRDVGSLILACSSNGSVYAISFDGTDLALVNQVDLEGQEPTAVEEAFGRVVLATREPTAGTSSIARLYTCVVTDAGALAELNVVRRWPEASGRTIRSIRKGIRNSLFLSAQEPSTGETRMWRYDLATGGLHSSYISADEGRVRSILQVEDRMWWTIDGEGIYRASTTCADSGYLISAASDHFSVDDKSWASISLSPLEIESGGTISISYTTELDAMDDADSADWTGALSMGSLQTRSNVALSDVNARYLSVKVDIEKGTSTCGGRFDGFDVKSYPGESDILVRLPINVSDQIERPGRKRVRAKGHGLEVWNSLLGIEGTSQRLLLLEENVLFAGVIERVTNPSNFITNRGSNWSVSNVLFRGQIVDLLNFDVTLDSEPSIDLSETYSFDIGINPQETIDLDETWDFAVNTCEFPSESLYPSEDVYPC